MFSKIKYLKAILVLIGMMWATYFVSLFIPLTYYGIQPRHLDGMFGIIASPFLHANLVHLIANTTGLLTFGLIFALIEGRNTVKVILFLIIVQGLLTWMFARSGNHIGASGLVFGLFGHLLLLGFFHSRFSYVLVSVLVAVFYGTTIFGILPSAGPISWEAHLFGFIAGILSARYK